MATKSKYGHWKGKRFDENDYLGFVYVIENTTNGKKYIGQKLLHFKVTKPPLKGRKNKRRSTKISDWRTYTGSSKSLNEDIAKIGKSKFTFTIIELYETKWEMTYNEYSKIIKEDAIPSRGYYNEFLGKVGRCPEKAKLD